MPWLSAWGDCTGMDSAASHPTHKHTVKGEKKWPQCANLQASDAAALNKRLVGNMM